MYTSQSIHKHVHRPLLQASDKGPFIIHAVIILRLLQQARITAKLLEVC